MQNNAALSNHLQPYQDSIEKAILESVNELGPKNILRDACEYALTSGGKRVRPVLTLMIAKALGLNRNVMPSALSVEYFHTSSLVIDDLPSMDDDDLRRKRPSLHKKFGEGLALLTSYSLISAGYELLRKNVDVFDIQLVRGAFSSELGILALECVNFNTGLNGATGGQLLDLNPPDTSKATIREVIHKKTSSLFEISCVVGWLFGGGNLDMLPQVKLLASHFGQAFQIADDIGDREQDKKNQRLVNTANLFGIEEAIQMFHVEREGYLKCLIDLGIDTEELRLMVEALKEGL